ncbi:ABC transporter permease [Streptosporangium nondiastaticum]|uniref:ABC transporter permease n=1 Tax=Streptosporangium nondiastaticum TaxID=35764 RepID=A0A9X7PGR2_9ACTN|nr:FtsX-like permease family protein [Streptosporangium nondiastaticum]PSJ27370.1 ABC transporter permease [Streptosporangium nondiastaticum]
MLSIAMATVRTRWVSFLGAFVALALGTAMIAMMALTLFATTGTPHSGPQRFSRADSVVVPADPRGDPVRRPAAVPARTVARIATDAEVTADRTFDVTHDGSAGVGHGWSVARFAPYRLAAGHAPTARDQVVIGGGSRSRLGRTVQISTPAGVGAYQVVGVTDQVWFEDAVFFTDAEAARISPPVNALVVTGNADVEDIRKAAGHGMLVLDGNDRVKADPDPSGGANALAGASSMAGTTMAIATSVAAFIVIATFAFVVDQRRRELALLRLVGGTPRQVRRMVLTESALVGAAAAAVGCVLGTVASGALNTWMIDHGVAPRWFEIGVNPFALLLAFLLGVASALAGAATVALRASRVRPVEALRDAAANRRSMTAPRWLLGLGMLAGAVITGYALRDTPEIAVNPRKYGAVPLLFTGAFALLSPVVVWPIARLLTWPLTRFGAGPLLVRQNMLNARRRTVSTVVPVVVAVGLVATMLCVQVAGDRARVDQARRQTRADFVVTPQQGSALNDQTVQALRAVPGTTVTTVAPMRIYVSTLKGEVVDTLTGQAVPSRALGSVFTPKVIEGSLKNLGDDFLVIDERTAKSDNLTLGQHVYTWLPDGSRRPARIGAIIQTGLDGDATFLSAARAPAGTDVKHAWVTLRPGADIKDVRQRLAAALAHQPVETGPAEAYFARVKDAHAQKTATAATVILGISVGYSLISVANTLIMAAAGRRRELAALHLAGGTRAQTLRMVGAEAVLAAAIGTVLALGAGAAVIATQRLSLERIVTSPRLTVPWPDIWHTAALCMVVATVAAVLSTWRTTQGRAIDVMGMRE